MAGVRSPLVLCLSEIDLRRGGMLRIHGQGTGIGAQDRGSAAKYRKKEIKR